VIPDPSTGSVRTRRIDAESTVQLNRHDSIDTIPVLLDTSSDAMKVIDPPSELRPSTCSASIARLMLELELYVESDNGQYRVHPAEIPSSLEIASTTSIDAATSE
jgi:hypothetical protein